MMELLPFFLLVIYLVPFLVAAARSLDAAPLILIANLLVGWTGIGWLALLAWAVFSPTTGAGAAVPQRVSSNR
jgi:hypothetical protein